MTTPVLESVQIHLTHACNLRCKHCYLDAGKRRPDELAYEDWIRAVDGFPDTVQQVDLTGGEPLMVSWLFPLAAHLREKGYELALFTNASLITEKAAEDIGRLFANVFVSVDGLRAAHDAFRGLEGAFDRTIAGIRLLTHVGATVTINITLTDQLVPHLATLLEELSELDVSMIRLSKVLPFGRSTDNFLAQPELMRQLHAQLEATVEATEATVDWEMDIETYEDVRAHQHVCGAAVSHVSIRPNGSVTACSILAGNEFAAGNVRAQSLASLWEAPHSSLFRQLRDTRVRDVTDRCPDSCPVKEFCTGGCRAIAYLTSGDLHGPEQFCCSFMRGGLQTFTDIFPGACAISTACARQ